MQTTQLIEIATGAITDLETIQTMLDDCASRTTTKREANDLGFIVGLNSKLSNDVNPWHWGPLALSFDLGFEEAQIDLDEFDFSDDGGDDEPEPTPPNAGAPARAAPTRKQPSMDVAAPATPVIELAPGIS